MVKDLFIIFKLRSNKIARHSTELYKFLLVISGSVDAGREATGAGTCPG